MQRKIRGFTIVEILIVIVVIAILAAITVVAYNGVSGKARDTRRLNDMAQIQKALELYKIQEGRYPAHRTNSSGSWESSGGSGVFLDRLINTGVVSSVPVDPVNTSHDSSVKPEGNSSNYYVYIYYRYTAGSNGCDGSRGAYYVLIVTRMNTVPAGQSHPDSPGFKCTTRDWVNAGAWVTGAYENG